MPRHDQWPYEPELLQSPPRPIRLTRVGWRELALALVSVLGGLSLCTWLFFSRPQEFWTEVAFTVFSFLGLYLLIRVGAVWLSRIDLVREGRPLQGVVIEKKPEINPLSRYVVWYSLEGEQWSVTGVAERTMAEVGDAVTVLYIPGEPAHSLIYPASRCAAVDPNNPAPHAGEPSLSAQS